MEAKLLIQSRSPFSTPPSGWRHKREPECRSIVAVLTRLPDNIPTAANEKQRISVYRDNWFDQMAINYLSRSLQVTTGCRNSKTGYDSLVEAATMVFRNFDGDQQREVVVHALHRAFPSLILSMIRALLPQSKFTREYFAAFTTVFFAWLVGPSEVRESELNGRREKNVVYINKCRFLEQTNCVGMCTNLCKMPSQAFIKDSLGMPVNMVPNFDDMSCEMIFGQDPPAPTDDPAFKQPCYKLCNSKANQKHNFKCSS